MDQPGLDRLEHRRALLGLRRVNCVSGTARVLSRCIARIAAARQLRELRVLDVACGGGDVALAVARGARRRGLQLHVDGWDRSPTAVRHARELNAGTGLTSATFLQRDVVEEPFDDSYDVVYSTLFLHHLEDREAVRLMRRMREAARYAVLIDDLRRSRLGYFLAWWGCRLLTRSPVVRVDGPLSVRAAFTVAEVERLAAESGLAGATVERHWPQRFLLTWNRD